MKNNHSKFQTQSKSQAEFTNNKKKYVRTILFKALKYISKRFWYQSQTDFLQKKEKKKTLLVTVK